MNQNYHRYLPKVARSLCVRIAQGEALAAVCGTRNEASKQKMPALSVVIHWLATEPQFRALYERARELQADTMVDEIRTIAREAEAAGECTPARAAMTRLQVQCRQWAAARLAPGRYSDKAVGVRTRRRLAKHEPVA